MKLITTEKARVIVEDLKDGHGRPVDPGIVDALVDFTRVVLALGFKTSQSCEGHIDWGFPFPWIDFVVSDERVLVPSGWKVWKWRARHRIMSENKKHAQNAEKKTDQLCVMLTRFLLLYSKTHSVQLDAMLTVSRRSRFCFRLKPVYTLLSEAYKTSSDNVTLNDLLEKQRLTFKSFASFCVDALEREQNLIGTPEEGCKGCMGRG